LKIKENEAELGTREITGCEYGLAILKYFRNEHKTDTALQFNVTQETENNKSI
jgi:hypothetical protein